MGIINTGSFPRLLLPGITTLFGMEYSQLDGLHDKIFQKKSSQRAFEEAVQLVGMGMAEKLGEGEALQLDTTKQGYSRRTYHEVWSKAAMITQVAFDDNLYQDQAQVLSKQLAKALFHAKENNARLLFDNCTSTSAPYVGADGKALLATDHPTGSGATFSNLSTSDLSELALENARNAIRGWVGSDGLLINANIKGLLVPPQLRFEAHRILMSTQRSGTANNDTNAIRELGMIPQIMEWAFLTDTNNWYLLTDVDGLVMYERKAMEPRYYMENETMNHVYQMSERYSFDYFDPRAVYGANV